MQIPLIAIIGIALISNPLLAAETWKPVDKKLMTRWAKEVSPDKVHPEYPRPQLVRPRWQNLNGLWDYAIKPKADIRPAAFDGKILVPFSVESALSGVGKQVGPDNKLWYRRSFTVPADWTTASQRLLMHFGACDWEATVYVNGKEVGTHRGGYDPFSFDVTDALKSEGEQEVIVEVWDPTDAGFQPRGKQVRNPHGIWYTPITGIWQTVWIEPVPDIHVKRLTITPDVDRSEVSIQLELPRREEITQTKVEIFAEDPQKPILSQTVSEDGMTLPIPKPRLWSPADPFLYRLRLSLKSGDTIESYFAFRKLSVAKDDKGITRLMLNYKFLFQFGTLDQGFWPDGLYTAPTDAALRYDLEVTKKLGFNMVRKHVKVEPARWYRHCDELGLLVWQDMPNGDGHIGPSAPEDFQRSPESMKNYEQEWSNIINALRNHPSIVMWVPFNEGWGQSDTARIADFTKKLDPTRWVNSASGWRDRGVGDVLDLHVYPGPVPSKDALTPLGDRALVLGEFGGLGMPVKGHTWQDEKNWGYRSYDSAEALGDAYVSLLQKLHPLIGDPGYSAAVYTQTTDVEIEVNGLMTYDREVIKYDEARIAAAAKKLYGPPPVITTIVPDARKAEIAWRYTFEKPAGDWQKPGFDDGKWSEGSAGFGVAMTPNTTVRTEWKGKQIWVRRSFDLPSDQPLDSLYLMIHHDEDAAVYLNGVLAAQTTGYTTNYVAMPISAEAAKTLKPGKNVIAIQCTQSTGGQYIDAGIVQVK